MLSERSKSLFFFFKYGRVVKFNWFFLKQQKIVNYRQHFIYLKMNVQDVTWLILSVTYGRKLFNYFTLLSPKLGFVRSN